MKKIKESSEGEDLFEIAVDIARRALNKFSGPLRAEIQQFVDEADEFYSGDYAFDDSMQTEGAYYLISKLVSKCKDLALKKEMQKFIDDYHEFDASMHESTKKASSKKSLMESIKTIIRK